MPTRRPCGKLRSEAHEEQHCHVVSLCDVLSLLGSTSVQVVRDFGVRAVDTRTCLYANSVTSRPTEEFTSGAARAYPGTRPRAARSGTVSRPSNRTVQTQVRTVDGLAVRCAESEDRDEDALLLSPWPESLFAFRPMWSRLSESARLVAVDLPGFGHSEHREELMSPRAMGEFLVHVADAFGLAHPHVVGPDVGTGAALFAAALYPGRFRSLVVGSGGAAVPLQLGGPLREWVEDPDIEKYRTADARKIVAAALATLEHYEIPDDITEDYLSSYAGGRFFRSMAYVRAYPTDLPALAALLPGLTTPVQHIAGGHDRAVPPANSVYLHERLPHSKLDILDAGHFTWEDASDAYAELVTDWWGGGYRSV